MEEMAMYREPREYNHYHHRSFSSTGHPISIKYDHSPLRPYEHEDAYGTYSFFTMNQAGKSSEIIDLRRDRNKELDSPNGQIIWDDIGDGELAETLSWSQSDVEREIETWDRRLKASESFGRRVVTWNDNMIHFNDGDDDAYTPSKAVVNKKQQRLRSSNESKNDKSLYTYHRKEDVDSSGQLLLPKRVSARRQTPEPKEIKSRDSSFERTKLPMRPRTSNHSVVEEDALQAPDAMRPDMSFYHQQTSTPSLLSPASGLMCLSSRHWLGIILIILVGGAVAVSLPYALNTEDSNFQQRLHVATAILKEVPLIDGHNDLPWNIRKFLHNRLKDFNFNDDLRRVLPWSKSAWSHTDLPRLKAGKISAQFWAAYVPCEAQFKDAVQLSFEQVDVIRRFTERYKPDLTLCTSSHDIEKAHRNGQMCSFIGVEGGHSMGSSLAILRALYEVGVRYLTLTSTCNTPWADCSLMDTSKLNSRQSGLTAFGKSVVREMNRLGMLVDLSHVSEATMVAALNVSKAPVIFSHSAAQALCNSSRNVPDHVLKLLAANDGIIMINFYSKFLSCGESATIKDAIAHIEHVRKVAGAEHVGLGAGYDGINITPDKLNDVSSYPVLFAELISTGWSEEHLKRLAGLNFIRVLRKVEVIRDQLQQAGVGPSEEVISPRFLIAHSNCSSKNLF